MNDLNAWQLTRQIQYLIQKAAWPTVWGGGPARGSGQVLFLPEAVMISAMPPELVLDRVQVPFCLVRPPRSTGDREVPTHDSETTWVVTVVAKNERDPRGEGAVSGALRDEIGKSQGRGVDEILLAQVRPQLLAAGIAARPRNSSSPVPILLPDMQVAVARDLELWALRVQAGAPDYTSPSRFLATKTGPGAFSLSWLLPPDRFDVAQLVLNRKEGSTPSSPTDGTVLLSPTGGVAVLPTVFVDAIPVTHTWTWALWIGYDEGGITPPDYNYSRALNATGTG